MTAPDSARSTAICRLCRLFRGSLAIWSMSTQSGTRRKGRKVMKVLSFTPGGACLGVCGLKAIEVRMSVPATRLFTDLHTLQVDRNDCSDMTRTDQHATASTFSSVLIMPLGYQRLETLSHFFRHRPVGELRTNPKTPSHVDPSVLPDMSYLDSCNWKEHRFNPQKPDCSKWFERLSA